jgi:hypothetical protein
LWVVVWLSAGSQAFSQTLQKVTLSYSSSGITSIEFFIAKEKKFFQEEGLEPLLMQMSANTAIAAGVTGELTGLSSIGSAIRAMALESYRLAKPAFTVTGIPTEDEIKEYLILDSQILKLPQPVAPSSVFDFTLQREVNNELGIK